MMINIFLTINNFLVQRAYAQSIGASLEEGLSVDSDTNVDSLIERIVRIAVPVAVISAFALLSYGGYLLISSQGNPDKLQEARSIITNAIIGLLVVVLSVAILLIISGTFDLNIFN